MIFMDDHNVEPNEATMFDFFQVYNISNLIKDYTCYKNLENPSCIDLILTNKPKLFLRSAVTETVLSDFYKIILVIEKTHFAKQTPQIVVYLLEDIFDNDQVHIVMGNISDALKSCITKLIRFPYEKKF